MNRFENWKKPEFDLYGWAYGKKYTKQNPDTGFEYETYGFPYNWLCQHHSNLILGNNTDIGFGTYINAKFGVEIGENTQIGSHVSIYSENTENDTQGKVIIGKNCMIGSFCLILPNAVIPDGSKIKAYSVIK